jgi:hypothetical protein
MTKSSPAAAPHAPSGRHARPVAAVRARLLAFAAAGLTATGALLPIQTALAQNAPTTDASAEGKKDFSQAERLLLMSPQFGGIKPPTTLKYAFRKAGTLEDGYTDQVSVKLSAGAGGKCCKAVGEFLTGARKVSLPDIDDAEGNPATLYFLEHDIREMQRLTKGSNSYFRKRIRMALYQGATVTPSQATWRGKPVEAQDIAIEPYLDDPNRAKFEKFAGKRYVFTLSGAVPGGVVGIRTEVAGAGDTPALLSEEMVLEGAALPGAKP